MLDQNFSPANLEKYIYSRSDLIRLKLGRSETERRNILTSLSYRVEGAFSFSNLRTRKIGGRLVHTPNDGAETLLLRKLNDNIVRIFGVRQCNRADTTKQIYTLLQEANPMSIARLDVKGFYEHIELSDTLKPIYSSTVLSPTSKKLLKAIEVDPRFVNRLPRGINISAALSELKMRTFDRAVAELEHVYFYARYVDDIFIFSYKTELDLNEITCLLPKGLYVNREKSYVKKVHCRNLGEKKNNPCVSSCKCKPNARLDHAAEYLGYEYRFSDVPFAKKGSPRKVQITLSQRKIQKIKTRMVKSFLSHVQNPNLDLLESRLRFLTGNCEFEVKGGLTVRSGLAYNFPLLQHDDASLPELTTFLRKLVHCKRGSMGAKLSLVLTGSERTRLGKLSFVSGHRNKITYRFSEMTLAAIKGCWAK